MMQKLQRLAVIKAIADEAGAALKEEIRPEAQRALEEAYAALGADRFTVDLDGAHVATVSFVKPVTKVSARVVDEDALIDWVAEEYPKEIRRTISEGILQTLLTRAQQGEVFPGVEIDEVETAPGHQVRFTATGKQTIGRMLHAGQVKELLPGNEDA